ncbi:globin [Kyrpidia spormannii]|uniref:Globin n=1 Tax=Kyrpidia spormannii TaxID=2055160 RepID=A0A2K8N8W7_9BACL|nr:globin [Kyrpidia spormannii]ATY85771.1 globin [Kyrpidia spormannii]CAB3395391.1 putative thiol management oxidoreductase component [Kyrpidia spormannii]HHY65857.1 globin [Alicyclobacillus sp.]
MLQPFAPDQTPYELIGGAETVQRLVNAFYKRVGQHPDLKPIFPEDLTPVARRQYKFLTQFFGGPPLYSQEYGPPMLRARHMPFPITPKRARAWLSCMSEALEEAGIEEPIRGFLFERLTMTAHHMINTPDDEEAAPRKSIDPGRE